MADADTPTIGTAADANTSLVGAAASVPVDNASVAVMADADTPPLGAALSEPVGNASVAADRENFTAGADVAHIPELLEHILIDVEVRTLLLSERTSKVFQATIAGSKKLQRKLFMQVDPGTTEWQPNPLLGTRGDQVILAIVPGMSLKLMWLNKSGLMRLDVDEEIIKTTSSSTSSSTAGASTTNSPASTQEIAPAVATAPRVWSWRRMYYGSWRKMYHGFGPKSEVPQQSPDLSMRMDVYDICLDRLMNKFRQPARLGEVFRLAMRAFLNDKIWVQPP
ncbi:hypothetical protein LTR08_002584 [Meristemomyces frigidus]|nr:hypothetical protein LTR08_002584 [Meristemomyces frigidus]